MGDGLSDMVRRGEGYPSVYHEVEVLRQTLRDISYHAENQDMNHERFRIEAKRAADHALGK